MFLIFLIILIFLIFNIVGEIGSFDSHGGYWHRTRHGIRSINVGGLVFRKSHIRKAAPGTEATNGEVVRHRDK